MTKAIEFDEQGIAIPGTYPLSTVSIGMWKSDGTPSPTVDSAVCDVCGDWASNMWISGQTTTVGDSLYDVRISRRMRVVVYACPEHSDDVANALTDEYGSTTNAYDPDELALRVDKSQRAF